MRIINVLLINILEQIKNKLEYYIFQCDINKNTNDIIANYLIEHYKKENILKLKKKLEK